MAITIHVQINPAMGGWRSEIWYKYEGEWFVLYDSLTGSDGKDTLTLASSYYPISLKVVVPAQTMGGIAYLAQEQLPVSYDNGDVDYVTFDMIAIVDDRLPTTITVNAPSSVNPDELFYVTGSLYESGSGLAVPGHLVSISYDGVVLGNVMTGIDGEYLIEALIPTGGSFTLTASFAGTGSLRASIGRFFKAGRT